MPSLSPIAWLMLSLAVVVTVGLAVLLRSKSRLVSTLVFTAKYREQVRALVAQEDAVIYEWLTLNANRMQTQMGTEGLVTFRPPFANYVVNNYPVVLNVLTELRKCLNDRLPSRDLLIQYHAMLDDALLRHQGSLIQRHKHAAAELRNPFIWLAVGFRTVLVAPLWFLASLGIVSWSFASRVESSHIYRVLSGTIAAIGFLSAVVGLVTGWEQFLAILRKVVPGAF